MTLSYFHIVVDHQHRPYPELFWSPTLKFYPLNTNSPFSTPYPPWTPATGNFSSTFRLYEFDYSRYLPLSESNNICPSVSSSFHLALCGSFFLFHFNFSSSAFLLTCTKVLGHKGLVLHYR